MRSTPSRRIVNPSRQSRKTLRKFSSRERERETRNIAITVYRPPRRKLRQTETRKCDTRKDRLEMPVLKKYLPAYQTPELMEELKEHERMRLIREREARRWTALNALRGTRDSSPFSAKSRDRTSRDTWVRRVTFADALSKTRTFTIVEYQYRCQ